MSLIASFIVFNVGLDKAPMIIPRPTFGVISSSTENKMKSIIKYVIIEGISYRFGSLTVTSDTSTFLKPKTAVRILSYMSAPVGMYVLPSKKVDFLTKLLLFLLISRPNYYFSCD